MGSWLLPAVETRETRSPAGAASCTGPVFTAFRNAFSSLTGVHCNESGAVFNEFRNALSSVGVGGWRKSGARNATHPQRTSGASRGGSEPIRISR